MPPPRYSKVDAEEVVIIMQSFIISFHDLMIILVFLLPPLDFLHHLVHSS